MSRSAERFAPDAAHGNMKAFTGEQISDWFTGAPFVNLKLTERDAERQRDSPASRDTRYENQSRG